MSRCFQYPPPGYSPNTASNYALIESIKLQRYEERVKLERKKENRRKKKERFRKKEKKAKQVSTSSCFRTGDLISRGDNRESRTKYLQKDVEDEIVERLENSSLSEEHGKPVCSQDPSYSSDSTQNNNKIKRSTSSSNGIHDHGPNVRIRLSSHNHGQCDISIKEDCFKESANYEVERASPLSKTKQQLSPFMSEDKTTNVSCSKLHGNDLELEFKNLIINCVPPSSRYEFDDQDWLFRRKHEQMRVKEKGEVSNDMSCGTSALLPRAQYLDDAELYAFPFTVPF
ncbi:hypothetical protein KY290_009904 [Solanum tuberosum]|uniref:Uncharacterized protein n=1 Tax=Solanum tuberosum TaxID=4113 RepID=A0ABQ7VW92_SOLTU|nr:hypothetical protein KY289_010285 [Solanum tuberosum]KAH0772767.1 hypothetical protein KY290_009904 [Solanum tuberosum]